LVEVSSIAIWQVRRRSVSGEGTVAGSQKDLPTSPGANSPTSPSAPRPRTWVRFLYAILAPVLTRYEVEVEAPDTSTQGLTASDELSSTCRLRLVENRKPVNRLFQWLLGRKVKPTGA
jgi:hypothetical protein